MLSFRIVVSAGICNYHIVQYLKNRRGVLLGTEQVSVLLKPYFGVGGVVINTEGGSALLRDMSDWGANLLCGVRIGGGGISPFVEGKYQVMKDFKDQIILSAGVNLSTW